MYNWNQMPWNDRVEWIEDYAPDTQINLQSFYAKPMKTKKKQQLNRCFISPLEWDNVCNNK